MQKWVGSLVLISLFGCSTGGGGNDTTGGSFSVSGPGNTIPPGAQPIVRATPPPSNRVLELVNRTLADVAPRLFYTEDVRPLVDVDGDNAGRNPRVSATGRYIGFISGSDRLVEGDTNGLVDTFVRDRQTQTTSLVRVVNNSLTFLGPSIPASEISFLHLLEFEQLRQQLATLHPGRITLPFDISPNGRYGTYVLFNGTYYQAFLHDLQTNTSTDLFPGAAGNTGDLRFSADGTQIWFSSEAVNLVPGDQNGVRDIFRYRLSDGNIQRVTVKADGTEFNGASFNLHFSSDDRYLCFTSAASNLVAGDTNGKNDIFWMDRQSGEIRLVSRGFNGPADAESYFSDISGDGAKVVFNTGASNIVAEDTNGIPDVFLYSREQDRVLGRLSLTDRLRQALKEEPDSHFNDLDMSENGEWVGFESEARNMLVGFNGGGGSNVYVTNTVVPIPWKPLTADPDLNRLTFTGTTNASTEEINRNTAIEVNGSTGPAPDRIMGLGLSANARTPELNRQFFINLAPLRPFPTAATLTLMTVGTTWEFPYESQEAHVSYEQFTDAPGGIQGNLRKWSSGRSGIITLVGLTTLAPKEVQISLRFDDVVMLPDNAQATGEFRINGTMTFTAAISP